MHRTLMMSGLVLAVLLALLWATGGIAVVQRMAADGQRQVQDALAGAVRALRGGQPGALIGLLSVAFAYGFLHAAGPGHGKVLIGGYGVARRVRLWPLIGIALLASLAQAAMAVGLVYAGILALGWTRERMVGLTEGVMASISYGAIAAMGVWLVWRGFAALRRQHEPKADRHDHSDSRNHGHDHNHDHERDHVHDAHCGHAHGPSIDAVAHLTGWRDTAALVAGIAIRPCTGALFLLILTWQLGIGAAGIAGAFAMGLGTASVTVAVAILAVWAREGALAALPGAKVVRALPWIELGAGAVLAVVAISLLTQSI